jgi:hypothetical protein
MAGAVVNTSGSATTTSGGGGGGGGGCFIATAVYGPESREVYILRQFRDRRLLTNGPGRLFVATYYKYSPPIARFMHPGPVLRVAGRCILWPLVSAVSHPRMALFLVVAAVVVAGGQAGRGRARRGRACAA